MPTNSNYDGYFQGIGQVPLFTYGMIAVTTIVLGYMTWMDTGIEEEEVPVVEESGVVPESSVDLTQQEVIQEPILEPIQESLEQQQQEEEPLAISQEPEVLNEPLTEPLGISQEPIQQKQQGGKRIRKTKRRRPE
jgi:hypothetical protein